MVHLPTCNCPHATELFTLLGKKWSIFIMQAVDMGSHTFTKIRENTGNPNTKILTDRLAELVDIGVLSKSETSEYRLSELGSSLSKRLIDLSHWWGESKEKNNP